MAGNTPTVHQWNIFFDALDEAESIATACRKSGIPRSTAKWNQKNVKWIKERWEEAEQNAVDYLKDAATERAVIGVSSTYNIYNRDGDVVASRVETKYSDRLLLALLAARDPAFRNSSSDQVQQQLTRELTRMLDLFQRKLPPDVYALVIEVLSSDDVIDVAPIISEEAPRYLNGEQGS
jgi:hypothetical protein